jgi:hypothetical protein
MPTDNSTALPKPASSQPFSKAGLILFDILETMQGRKNELAAEQKKWTRLGASETAHVREYEGEQIGWVICILQGLMKTHGYQEPQCDGGDRMIASLFSQVLRLRDEKRELLNLLQSLHSWFMEKAPEHYNGCGLWIDVDITLRQSSDREVSKPAPGWFAKAHQSAVANIKETV